jgi:hypothetical protein
MTDLLAIALVGIHLGTVHGPSKVVQGPDPQLNPGA